MTALPIPRLRPQGVVGLAGLPDQFGRVARDLRVSVTDRCNLRCTYCMPAEGLPWLPKPEMLSDEELLRVIGVFVDLGVRQVRLTGGEPLLRRSIVDVVAGIAALQPRPSLRNSTLRGRDPSSLSFTEMVPSCAATDSDRALGSNHLPQRRRTG